MTRKSRGKKDKIAAPQSCAQPQEEAEASNADAFTPVTRKSRGKKGRKLGTSESAAGATGPAEGNHGGWLSPKIAAIRAPPKFAEDSQENLPPRNMLPVLPASGAGEGEVAGGWSYEQYCQIPGDVEDLICCPISQVESFAFHMTSDVDQIWAVHVALSYIAVPGCT